MAVKTEREREREREREGCSSHHLQKTGAYCGSPLQGTKLVHSRSTVSDPTNIYSWHYYAAIVTIVKNSCIRIVTWISTKLNGLLLVRHATPQKHFITIC